MKILKILCLFAFVLSTTVYTTSCKDDCSSSSCENGGTCVDGDCNCADGYEGNTCSAESRDKFEGDWTYSGISGCTFVVNRPSKISEETSNVLQVTMTNLTGYSETVIANVDGNTITIPVQTVDDIDGDSWTISSNTATIADNSFTLEVDYSGFATMMCTLEFNMQ